MSQVITNQMPIGNVGDITRDGVGGLVVESQTMGAVPLTAYGLPCKFASGALVGVELGDTDTALVKGFLVRVAPSLPGSGTNEAFGVATPPLAGAVVNLMRSGYMAVKNNYGTPAKEGQVYVRTAATSGARLLGGIEATDDGANNMPIPGCFFTGAAVDGVAEIRVNIA
jgi:hypothetical protein